MKNEEQEKQPELSAEEWGVKLSTARESLGITAAQMATELNLPNEYITTLESGELDGLPSIVFARGYIRAYAKYLKMDDDLLVAEYEGIHGQNSIKGQIKSVSSVRDQVEINDPVMKFSTWVFVFIIIGLSVWWWQAQDGGFLNIKGSFLGEKDVAVEVVENEPAATNGESALVLPKLVDAPVDVEEVTPREGELAEEETAENIEKEPVYLSQEDVKKLQESVDKQEATTDTIAETDNALPEVNAVLSEGRIDANFVAECWVTIKDVNGKTLFNNLRGKGQSINVVGKPPLSVLIGATSAVGDFSFNGSPIDLQKYSSKNIVRMSLPLAE